MERGGLGRSLSSILSGAREVREPERGGASACVTPSLALAYQAIAMLVDARDLRDVVVVLDDRELGRQLLAAGRRPLTADDESLLAGPPGCWTEPPATASALELELVQRVCATALRAAAREPDLGSPVDALEFALRQLPGVYGVAVDAEDPIVEVHAFADTEPDLARRAGSLARAHLEDVLTVDLVRGGGARRAPPAVPTPNGEMAALALESPRREPLGPESEAPVPAITLVSARTLPGYQTIEVRLAGPDAARVGRAPRRQGLAGAVTATLDAAGASNLAPVWAREVRTTTEGRCTVAVALRAAALGRLRYGTGEGDDAIEAAARAALAAITNPAETAPAGTELA